MRRSSIPDSHWLQPRQDTPREHVRVLNLVLVRLFIGAMIFGNAVRIAAAQPTLVVRRSVHDSVVLGVPDIARLPRVQVRATEHGKTSTFDGVSLQSVLVAAGVRMDSLRGPALTDVAVVEARDAYRAVFTLAELARDLGGVTVIVADRRDGVPLGAIEGPLRLVVPGDGRASRWVRQLRSIAVRRLEP
jgi:hypothetical protein